MLQTVHNPPVAIEHVGSRRTVQSGAFNWITEILPVQGLSQTKRPGQKTGGSAQQGEAMQIIAAGGVSWGWAVIPALIALAVLGFLAWFISKKDRS
jgi:hypothetical protein